MNLSDIMSREERVTLLKLTDRRKLDRKHIELTCDLPFGMDAWNGRTKRFIKWRRGLEGPLSIYLSSEDILKVIDVNGNILDWQQEYGYYQMRNAKYLTPDEVKFAKQANNITNELKSTKRANDTTKGAAVARIKATEKVELIAPLPATVCSISRELDEALIVFNAKNRNAPKRQKHHNDGSHVHEPVRVPSTPVTDTVPLLSSVIPYTSTSPLPLLPVTIPAPPEHKQLSSEHSPDLVVPSLSKVLPESAAASCGSCDPAPVVSAPPSCQFPPFNPFALSRQLSSPNNVSNPVQQSVLQYNITAGVQMHTVSPPLTPPITPVTTPTRVPFVSDVETSVQLHTAPKRLSPLTLSACAAEYARASQAVPEHAPHCVSHVSSHSRTEGMGSRHSYFLPAPLAVPPPLLSLPPPHFTSQPLRTLLPSQPPFQPPPLQSPLPPPTVHSSRSMHMPALHTARLCKGSRVRIVKGTYSGLSGTVKGAAKAGGVVLRGQWSVRVVLRDGSTMPATLPTDFLTAY